MGEVVWRMWHRQRTYQGLIYPKSDVGKGSSILDLESLEESGSHIRNSNSTLVMPPSLKHYYTLIHSFIHSCIPLFNKSLLSVHCVPHSVLALGTCNEQEILDSFCYITYNLEENQ